MRNESFCIYVLQNRYYSFADTRIVGNEQTNMRQDLNIITLEVSICSRYRSFLPRKKFFKVIFTFTRPKD